MTNPMLHGDATERIESWIAGYERAWRTEGTEILGELFTEDASYRMSPYGEPARGLAEIADLWEREREGHDEPFEMRPGVVAAEDDVAVVRVEVNYLKPGGAEYRDLWIVRFAPDGLCCEFEEWPFWPGRPFAPG
jgi:ketosteroid isomerase-like protein